MGFHSSLLKGVTILRHNNCCTDTSSQTFANNCPQHSREDADTVLMSESDHLEDTDEISSKHNAKVKEAQGSQDLNQFPKIIETILPLKYRLFSQ